MRAWRLTDADWNSWPGGLDDAQVLAQAAGLGLAGIELGVYDAAVQLAPDRLAALAAGPVPVTAVLLSLPAEDWPEGALGGDVERLHGQVKACAQACRELGLPVLGVWPGADEVGADVLYGLQRCVATAGEVRIALEYKPDTAVESAEQARELCDEVEGLGVLLDTGHAFAAGEDPAAVVELLGDRLLHVHLGDAAPGGADDDLPCGRLHDFAPLLAALDRSGYAGTASFDLYGAVTTGGMSGLAAVTESIEHLRSRP